MLNNDFIPRIDAISLIAGGNKLISKAWLMNALATTPAADVEPKQRWISVTDTLPSIGGEYWTLRYFERLPTVQILKYGVPDGFDKEYFYAHDNKCGEDTVYGGITHWLPKSALPELPKGEYNAEVH